MKPRDKHSGPNVFVSWALLGATFLGLVWHATAEEAAPFAQTQAAGPISSTNATVNGMVVPNGLPTVAWFEWGTNSLLGNTTAQVEVGHGMAVVRVSKTIDGLDPFPNYQFRDGCREHCGRTGH